MTGTGFHNKFTAVVSSMKGVFEMGPVKSINIILAVIGISFVLIAVSIQTEVITGENLFQGEETRAVSGFPEFPIETEPSQREEGAGGVIATGEEGWTDCSGVDGGWEIADAVCRCQGFAGALPQSVNPCFQSVVDESFKASLPQEPNVCPVKEGGGGRGPAITRVKCSA